MAHLLDSSKGFYGFAAAGAPAWHGLGKIFTDADRLTVAQALEYGGLDFTVVKAPNVHYIPNLEDSTKDLEIFSEESFFTYRTDVNAILGAKLGRDYQVVQNHECFDVIDEILQHGNARIETAGSIDGGKKVFICLRYNEDIKVGGGDLVNQFVLISSSHDGSMSLRATPTNIRVVCNNTLTAALSGATKGISIRHTLKAADRLQDAARVLNLLNTNSQVNTENYNKMKETVISEAKMWDYFGNVFYTDDEIKSFQAGKKASEFISTRKKNIMNAVNRFAENGTGQNMTLKNGEPTMWTAYNAITGYLARKDFKSVNDRADNMLFGAGEKMIHEAGVLALAPEKVKPLRNVSGLTAGFSLN